jgi:hypothetical protein
MDRDLSRDRGAITRRSVVVLVYKIAPHDLSSGSMVDPEYVIESLSPYGGFAVQVQLRRDVAERLVWHHLLQTRGSVQLDEGRAILDNDEAFPDMLRDAVRHWVSTLPAIEAL